MAEIHMIKIPDKIDARTFAELCEKTSSEKRSRLFRFRQPADAYRTLFADLLVRRLIMRASGLRNEEIRFANGPFGKPFVPGLPTFEFNLSHSGDWAVCAVDTQAIGIDIERTDRVEWEIARTTFSPDEYEWLTQTDPPKRLALFYELWTIKESFIKMTGQGLRTPLDSFGVRKRNDGFELYQADRALPCRVAVYPVEGLYKMAVCASSADLPTSPFVVTPEELERDFP